MDIQKKKEEVTIQNWKEKLNEQEYFINVKGKYHPEIEGTLKANSILEGFIAQLLAEKDKEATDKVYRKLIGLIQDPINQDEEKTGLNNDAVVDSLLDMIALHDEELFNSPITNN